MSRLTYRTATDADADRIAELHSASWRRHYRMAYPRDYLHSLDEEKLQQWRKVLLGPSSTITYLAERGADLAGFVHLEPSDETNWGSLIDSLHVVDDSHRHGVGTDLLVMARSAVSGPVHLWVLEQNHDARAFYRSTGGREIDAHPAPPPALPGVQVIRCAWDPIGHR